MAEAPVQVKQEEECRWLQMPGQSSVWIVFFLDVEYFFSVLNIVVVQILQFLPQIAAVAPGSGSGSGSG